MEGTAGGWQIGSAKIGRIAVVSLLIVIFAFDALVQLDGLLRGMHVAGQPSVGVSDLASADPLRVRSVWEAHAAATSAPGRTGFETIYLIHFLVDCLLAISLGLLLIAVVSLVGVGRPKAVAAVSAVCYVIFDLLENAVSALVVLGGVSVSASILVLMVLKWLALGIVVVLAAGQARQRWQLQPASEQLERRDLVHLLRILLFVAPLFGLALIAHPQIPDLIRRWTLLQLVFALAFACFLAATIWVVASQLAMQRRPWGFLRKPPIIVAILVGAGIAQFAATLILWQFDLEWDLGWGLLIPAGIVLIGAALGWIVGGGDSEVQERTLGAWSQTLPALLASLVLVGLGLGALRASFGDSVFTSSIWTRDQILTSFDEQLHPAVLVVFALLMPAAAWLLFRRLVAIAPDLVNASNDEHDANTDEQNSEPADEETPPLSHVMTGKRWTLAVLAAVALVLVLIVALWVNVHFVAEHIGGVAVLAAFLAALAMLGGAIVWLSDSIAYPRALPGRSAPIVLMLVAWFIVAVQFDTQGPHDVRVLPTERAAIGAELSQVWGCWLRKNGLQLGDQSCPFDTSDFSYGTRRTDGVVPLVVVATSGGATRAAYWTATVLDCIFEVKGSESSCTDADQRVVAGNFDRSNSLFALSGVSGGSVGLASYASYLAERADRGAQGSWIDGRMDRDFLSPTISWSLFLELPQSLLRFRHPADAAEVLEKSWERAWAKTGGQGDLGMFELWRAHHVVPLLLMNGTSVEDGCRFNGSVLDGSVETVETIKSEETGTTSRRRFHDCRATGPFDEIDRPKVSSTVLPKSVLGATRDLTDFLCGRAVDVPLSTAAVLSARFPYVSPSGRLERRCADEDQGNKVTYVVDGGYLETSGASPLVELNDKLDPMIRIYNDRPGNANCVVPFMIQIDNGYEDDAAARATKRPTEILVPPATILAVRGARAAGAKAQAALLYDRPYGTTKLNAPPTDDDRLSDRYAHFVIQTHAGPKAPLGWALSRTARDALRSQLKQPKNAEALREVRQWLEPGAMSCR